MSLQDILLDLATQGAIKINNADQLLYTKFRVNLAAQEIYTKNDLIGCLKAQIFGVEIESGNLLSLPFSVGDLRAVRSYIPQFNLGVFDMRARFQPKMWNSQGAIGWTIRGENSLQKDITNASLLTFTFKEAVSEVVTITIKGETSKASLASESLLFNIGDTTKTTTNSFTAIPTSIGKSIATLSDCSITDVDSVLLATIPNNQLRSLYFIVQLVNLPNSIIQGYEPFNQFVDVLFKERFRPFINNTDEFQCPGYDKAIVWKYLEHKNATMPGNEKLAIGYHEKCKEIVQDIEKNSLKDVENKMIIEKPRVYGVYDKYLNDNVWIGTSCTNC